MNTGKREGLEKQLQRQNKLLDMVLEQNDHLRASLTCFTHLLQGIVISPDTIAEIKANKNVSGSAITEKLYNVGISAGILADLIEGKNFFRSTIADSMNGINVFRGTSPDSMNGINVFRGTSPDSMNGKNDFREASPDSMNGKNISGHASADSMDGKNNFGHASADSMNGINVFRDTSADSMNGKNDFAHASADSINGKNDFAHASADSMDGIQETTHPHSETGNSPLKTADGNVGKARTSQAVAKPVRKTENPANHFPFASSQDKNESAASAASPATEQKAIKPVRLSNLVTYLSFIVVRSNYKGLENSAKILIRLLDSPKQSLKDLQKVTGLSSNSIGKRIVSMKRFGLITRGAGRQLLITEKAMQAIEESRS